MPPPEPGLPGQPNRDDPDRCASVRSCHRPYSGVLRSLFTQPIASDFIGSVLTCASLMRPHLTHLSVQCSKPGRAAVIRWTSIRDWHLRQRGRAAARCDRVDACGSSNRCLPWDAAGALPNSLSPMKCHWRSGDGVVCAAPGAGCWSILLSLRKLRGRHASVRFRLESKIPRTGRVSDAGPRVQINIAQPR